MKNKEEIEQLAANLANPNVCKTTNWIEGYTQCQEYVGDKKYTEEDMMVIRNKLVSILPTGDISAWDMLQAVSKYTKWFDEYINSLNKQDNG